jgi:hypothetical protein
MSNSIKPSTILMRACNAIGVGEEHGIRVFCCNAITKVVFDYVHAGKKVKPHWDEQTHEELAYLRNLSEYKAAMKYLLMFAPDWVVADMLTSNPLHEKMEDAVWFRYSTPGCFDERIIALSMAAYMAKSEGN